MSRGTMLALLGLVGLLFLTGTVLTAVLVARRGDPGGDVRRDTVPPPTRRGCGCGR